MTSPHSVTQFKIGSVLKHAFLFFLAHCISMGCCALLESTLGIPETKTVSEVHENIVIALVVMAYLHFGIFRGIYDVYGSLTPISTIWLVIFLWTSSLSAIFMLLAFIGDYFSNIPPYLAKKGTALVYVLFIQASMLNMAIVAVQCLIPFRAAQVLIKRWLGNKISADKI